MALFTVDLDDEARERLEAHRVRLGARSWAEALRRLIVEGSKDASGGAAEISRGFDAEDLRDTLAGKPAVGTRKKLTRRRPGKPDETWFEVLVRYEGEKQIWERET